MSDSLKISNELKHETSPYLKQHQHNPVNWLPWGKKAFELAKLSNRLILVSIGYSACHWCHVMERESFENEQIAHFMNAHFICIKVDREERPDVDQLYMRATQLMNDGNGGWPLNCFTLPDGSPIYGGTYYPPQQWIHILQYLADFWITKAPKAIEFAQKLLEAIDHSVQNLAEDSQDLPRIHIISPSSLFDKNSWQTIINRVSQSFDFQQGGTNYAPKFPLPENWRFVMNFAYLHADYQTEIITNLTLQKMYFGGIYDQLGGGFARYSTDKDWFAPHFEKMLYDNAQLIVLYAEASKFTNNGNLKIMYLTVVNETISFLINELSNDLNLFYTALDADSEGIEGKYYIWTDKELKNELKDNYELFSQYYNTTAHGNWEHGANILYRKIDNTEFEYSLIKQNYSNIKNWKEDLKHAKNILYKKRKQRIAPGLDDKILFGQNAMMITALLKAFRICNEQKYLEIATSCYENLANSIKEDYQINHAVNSSRFIHGFLDDYAFWIQALIDLYQATFDEKYIKEANIYMLYCLDHFYDNSLGMFYYNNINLSDLVSKIIDIDDNVIPSSNAVMGHNLLTLARFQKNENYYNIAYKMVKKMEPQLLQYSWSKSCWVNLMGRFIYPEYEVCIIGTEYLNYSKQWDKICKYPFYLITGTDSKTQLSILNDKIADTNKTLIYICKNYSCLRPALNVEEALEILMADYSNWKNSNLFK